LRGTKWTLWDGGIHVPFVAQWKGRIPAGKVLDRPVIQLDLLPTAIAAAGGEVRPEWQLDGVNLLPHLEGKTTAAPHAALYWRFGIQYAVRQGDWKLTKPSINDTPHLFNLIQDPSEGNDLATKQPEKARQLQTLWDGWNKLNEAPRWIDLRWNSREAVGKKKVRDQRPQGKGAGRQPTDQQP
jgi:arylsulfatase A-like enzyme